MFNYFLKQLIIVHMLYECILPNACVSFTNYKCRLPDAVTKGYMGVCTTAVGRPNAVSKRTNKKSI